MVDEVETFTRRKSKSRLPLIASLIAIGCATWGFIEHHRAEVQATSLVNAQQQTAMLQKQLTTLQQQLADTNTKLTDLSKKTLPVSVVFHKATSGNGLVTYFKNNSTSPLDLAVLLSDPATGRRREANLVISASGFQEIGPAQGWTFAPGHHVQVTSAEFGTTEYVVPAN